MSVPPDQMESSLDSIRSNIPEVDTTIDTTSLTDNAPVQSDVSTLAPPQDIDAANIGDYTAYNETLDTLNPDSTVEGRLSGLLSQNSDYMNRAAAAGERMANRRGLLNSSMAVGAAHGAAIDAALPIAQQDAASFREQQFLNQGYSNEAARYLAEQSVTRENLQAGLEQDTLQFNQQNALENDRLNQAAQNQSNQAFADAQNEQNFAAVNADLTAQLSAIDNNLAMNLEQLAREYAILENLDSVQGAIYQQLISEMGTILASADTVAEATGQINQLLASASVEFEFSTGAGTTAGGPGQTEDTTRTPKDFEENPGSGNNTSAPSTGGEGGAGDGPSPN